MKLNFVISANRDFWILNSLKLFVTNPYILHVLEREGKEGEYEEIVSAPLRRTNKADFQSDHNYIDAKYQKYTEILVRRMDEIHGTDHGPDFWRKCFQLALLRHATLCLEVFQIAELNLNPEVHDCQILNTSSYVIPQSFDHHREIFENSCWGLEQTFSVYCDLFYKDLFPKIDVQYKSIGHQSRPTLRQRFSRSGLVNKLLRRLVEKFASIRSPRVGIIESYFSSKHVLGLVISSAGRIQPLRNYKVQKTSSHTDWSLRDSVSRHNPDFDRFDKLFFSTLRYAMPKSLLEDFPYVYAQFKNYSRHYAKLRWVVSEAWFSHESSAMALAVLKQQGVQHIANEHNYISYQFVGGNLKYQIPLTDEFISLGWNDGSFQNLVRGSSLFDWTEGIPQKRKEHDILFILGCPHSWAPEVNAAYGNSGGFGALSYFDFNNRFMEALGERTLGQTVVRAYPVFKSRLWQVWDQKFMFARFINRMKIYDDFSVSGRVLMQQSRLVVVNYLSTSYLESIVADIPTIFFWNKESYFFTDKHVGIFDELIAAGVCQTNPEDAADFVNKVKDDPDAWWMSPPVRSSRKSFLDANFGPPQHMIDYLLMKSKD